MKDKNKEIKKIGNCKISKEKKDWWMLKIVYAGFIWLVKQWWYRWRTTSLSGFDQVDGAISSLLSKRRSRVIFIDRYDESYLFDWICWWPWLSRLEY